MENICLQGVGIRSGIVWAGKLVFLMMDPCHIEGLFKFCTRITLIQI